MIGAGHYITIIHVHLEEDDLRIFVTQSFVYWRYMPTRATPDVSDYCIRNGCLEVEVGVGVSWLLWPLIGDSHVALVGFV